ncbi:MAG: hypothetical protein KQJ78_23160 [Deltaproteobacteria bacterium]|nr:hypothetical protein [Deltaproteobacteria bacterium]
MSRQGLVSLSGLVARLHRHPLWDRAMWAGADNPLLAGGAVAADIAPELGSIGINVGALFCSWWTSDHRTVWVMEPDTAALVRDTSIRFIPDAPPSSWGGRGIIIEGANRRGLVGDVFALGCYQCRGTGHYLDWQERFWLVALTQQGGAWVQSVPCGSQDFESDGDLDRWILRDDDPWSGEQRQISSEERRQIRECFQFVFAFSFFAARAGDWWHTEPAGDGPPLRNARGKAVRSGGRVTPLWSYRRLAISEPPLSEDAGSAADSPRGPLDTTDLVLRPAVVRAHWRRVGSRKEPRLIGTYAAQRWRRRLGSKVLV